MSLRKSVLLAITALLPLLSHAAPVAHTTDFIADNQRAGFNGFETLTEDTVFNFSHAENGIVVQYIGDGRDIWTNSYYRTGFEGTRSWYATGINTGYNSIKKEDGTAFDAVGMLVGSGFGGYCNNPYDPYGCDSVAPSLTLHYQLLDHGVVVDAGSFANHNPNGHYLGFSGGGFDEVRVWDRAQGGWPNQNALILDAVEMTSAVPEPETYAMFLAGLGLMAGVLRRRKVN